MDADERWGSAHASHDPLGSLDGVQDDRLGWIAYQVRANNAVIPLGTSGQVSVQCDMPPGSTGQTDFLFDVTGYFE